MASTAIYYQKSKVVQEEFKLIELTTQRELNVEHLKSIIDEVKEERRQLDDETILETFTLFNKVRSSTINLIKAISIWQESFTKPIRPRLMECDYIIDKMIKYIDIVNGTKLKRVFNFQFFRGNVLLLPYPNPKTIAPLKVSKALGEQIHLFSCPVEEELIFCYQFLINCLPEDIYKNRVVSLNQWLINAWIPRVWISEALSKFTNKHNEAANINAVNRNTTMTTATDISNNNANSRYKMHNRSSSTSRISRVSSNSSGANNNNTPLRHSVTANRLRARTASTTELNNTAGRGRTSSIISQVTDVSETAPSEPPNSLPNSLPNSPLVNINNRKVLAMRTLPGSRPSPLILVDPSKLTGGIEQSRRSSNATPSPANKSARSPSITPKTIKSTTPIRKNSTNKSTNKTPNHSANNAKLPVIKRRNQLLQNEAEKILALTGNMTAEMKEKLRLESETKQEAEAAVAKLNAEEARELEKLDLYYKEMSNLFIPKFNRRAVQTMALNGTDVDELDNQRDFQYKSNKVFFLHTTQAKENVLQSVLQAKTMTEQFSRTDGKLIAKRNRIIADRNANLKDNNKDYRPVSHTNSTAANGLPLQDIDDIPLDEEESEEESEPDHPDRREPATGLTATNSWEGNIPDGNLHTSNMEGYNSPSRMRTYTTDSLLTEGSNSIEYQTDQQQQQQSSIKGTPHMMSRQGTLRKMSAASRRMSDLTVTFSVDENDNSNSKGIALVDNYNPNAADPTGTNSSPKHNTIGNVGSPVHTKQTAQMSTPTHGNKTPTKHTSTGKNTAKSLTKGSQKVPLTPNIPVANTGTAAPAPLLKGSSSMSLDINSNANSDNNSPKSSIKAPLERSGSTVKAKKSFVRATENFKLSTAELRAGYVRATSPAKSPK